MKDRADAILQIAQANYLEALLPLRDALLTRMEEYAADRGHPIADPEVAQTVRVLLQARQPKRVLEVGTNIGYSAIGIGREPGAGGIVETIELDAPLVNVARGFVEEAMLECEVRFHHGAALKVIPRLAGPFDFVFIDCV